MTTHSSNKMHERKLINSCTSGYYRIQHFCLQHAERVPGPRDKLDIFCFPEINDFSHMELIKVFPGGDWERTARTSCSPFYILCLDFCSAFELHPLPHCCWIPRGQTNNTQRREMVINDRSPFMNDVMSVVCLYKCIHDTNRVQIINCSEIKAICWYFWCHKKSYK